MVRVHDEHGLGAPPVAGIDQCALLAGILHQTLDRRRIRADDADDAVGMTMLPKPMFSSFMANLRYSMF